MERERIIVGIDPDVEKSGVAILHPDGKLKLCKMPFPELIDYLNLCARLSTDYTIVVEKGWFNTANYHLCSNRGLRYAAKQGIDIGRNHETGRKIVEMAAHFGFKIEEVTPLKKIWKGRDGKITKEELESFAGPLPRCSQDERDAALLAWVYSGRPIKIGRAGKP